MGSSISHLHPGDRIDNFIVITKLGQGSEANVWKVQNKKNKIVALKVGKDLTLENINRHRLGDNPGFVKQLSSLKTNNRYDWFSMELKKGDLYSLCYANNFTSDIDFINSAALQLLNIIRYVHSKDYIISDLSVKNILYDYEINDKDHIKFYLTDFTKIIPHKRRRMYKGKNLGTPNYMATSAALGYTPSYWDDLESLGYILYYMYSRGNLPWTKFLTNGKLPALQFMVKQRNIPELVNNITYLNLKNYINYVYTKRKLHIEPTDMDYEFLFKCF